MIKHKFSNSDECSIIEYYRDVVKNDEIYEYLRDVDITGDLAKELTFDEMRDLRQIRAWKEVDAEA